MTVGLCVRPPNLSLLSFADLIRESMNTGVWSVIMDSRFRENDESWLG